MLGRPAPPHDLLDVSVSVESIGPASFAFDYEVACDGLLLVTGFTRLAVCERDTGRAVPMPGWLRDLFGRIPAAAEKDQ
jgi:acyl-CoA thioesterase FadM